MKIIRIVSLFFIVISCRETQVEDDAIYSVVTIPSHFPPLGSQNSNVKELDTAIISLGRFLFFETKLSRDSSISCGSCHEPNKAFTDGRAKSIGIDNHELRRSSMSLVNLLWRKNLMWDGKFTNLETQALDPIANEKEMDLPIDEAVDRINNDPFYTMKIKKAFGVDKLSQEQMAIAIAQFERTLISSNSKYDQYLKGSYTPSFQELNGLMLFYTHPIAGVERGANCGDCHSSVLQIDDSFHNNGLDANLTDEGRADVTAFGFDKGRFKTPSLRNIALTAPYMHDGRFQTLDEVLDHYNDHVVFNSPNLDVLMNISNTVGSQTLDLTDSEKEAILAFLNMLTDNEFVTDDRFQNPF